MRRNHAAIGGVVPGCVSAGIRKMHDVQYPTPCTLLPQGCQQLTDQGLQMSYISSHIRKMPGKSAGLESCESPGHSIPVKPYHAYRAAPRGEVRHAAGRCSTMRQRHQPTQQLTVSEHSRLPAAPALPAKPPRLTRQSAAAHPRGRSRPCGSS